MYYELSCKGITLEYLKEHVTVTYGKYYFSVTGYEINNIVAILTNLIPGININALIMDDINLKFNEDEYLSIGDNFLLEAEYIDDLISLFKQSEGLRLKLVRLKVPSSGSGGGVTNLV